MKRRVFTILAAVSLAVSLACVGLWVAGGVRKKIVGLPLGVALTLPPGAVELKRIYEYGELIQEEDWTGPLNPATMRRLSQREYGALGLFVRVGEERRGDGLPQPTVHPRIGCYWLLHIPLWVFFVATAWLPAWWLACEPPRRRRAYRLREGLCLNCGYDLRASKDRCPECGIRKGEPGR